MCRFFIPVSVRLCLSEPSATRWFITSSFAYTQTRERGLVMSQINNSGCADMVPLRGASSTACWRLGYVVFWGGFVVQFAIFMTLRHTCLFALPFLREIFMALPPLCLVSEVKTVSLRAKRTKMSRRCRFSQRSAWETCAKTPRESMAWRYKRWPVLWNVRAYHNRSAAVRYSSVTTPPPPKQGPVRLTTPQHGRNWPLHVVFRNKCQQAFFLFCFV